MVRIMRPGGRAMLQAWALEQEDTSRRKFHEQNVLVPWQLQQHFSLKSQPGGDSPASTSAAAEKGDMDGSPALHKTAAAAGGSTHQVTYQRFCHVYREGELENLLGRVPHCRLIESGYDRSNWFICFEKLTQ
jgi:transposase